MLLVTTNVIEGRRISRYHGVVTGEAMLRLFSTGGIRYSHVEQRVDYAGSHGPDVVVIMGEEIVVPGEGMANAGQRVRRRFTDVFRRENGEWRHDLRHVPSPEPREVVATRQVVDDANQPPEQRTQERRLMQLRLEQ